MSFLLKKMVLVAIAYLYAIFRGPAVRMARPPRRVVVIQMAKLGDMVCSTPVFRALKRHVPGVLVHVVGDAVNRHVLDRHPDVDAYHVFSGIAAMRRTLAQGRYGAAVVLGAPDVTSAFVAFTAGIPLVVVPETRSATPLNDRWYRLVARLLARVPHEEGEYAPGAYLRRLLPLGITDTDTTKHLAHSREAEERAERIVGSGTGPRVGITASAGNKIKEWPADRFAAVADHLIETYGAQVVVFGTERDRTETEAMLAHMRHADTVANTLGELSVDELKATIARLDLMVAADTGLIYIAEAYGVATVDIVGPIDEREQPPIGVRHRVVVPPGRARPALTVFNAKWYDEAEARRQAQATPVEAVVREVDDVLSTLSFIHR